jgi:hypothetical protein
MSEEYQDQSYMNNPETILNFPLPLATRDSDNDNS